MADLYSISLYSSYSSFRFMSAYSILYYSRVKVRLETVERLSVLSYLL